MRIMVNLTVVALAAFFPAFSTSAANVSDFINYSVVDGNNNLLPGRLHIPADYATNPNIERPLLLFLHGGGESGTNNLAQINANIDNLLAAAKQRGAFLYAPQTNSGWGSGGPSIPNAITMIDRTIADFNVDTNRVYVTGLSLGGGGVWNVLYQFADRIAASVPICAVWPPPNFMPSDHLDEPIWAFHGRFDTVIPATATRDAINSLLTEAGLPHPTYPPLFSFGPNVQFDFPPLDLHYTDWRGSHGIWGEVYNPATNGALYDWLFSQSQVPEPTTLTLVLMSLAAFCVCSTRLPR
jgi:predicted peptidase